MRNAPRCAVSLALAIGLVGCSSSGSAPEASARHPPCRLSTVAAVSKLDTSPVANSRLAIAGTTPLGVKAILNVPSGSQLYPAGESGDVYYGDSGTVARYDSQGRVKWALEGEHVGVALKPTTHNVVAVTSLGDVAVLDGTSGRLLACASGAGTANQPVIDGDTVGLVRAETGGPSPASAATSTTTILRFQPGSSGFQAFGKLPGQWELLADDAGTAVFGGHLANSVMTVTRLAWAGASNPAGAATGSRCGTTVDGKRAADPGGLSLDDTLDNYSDYNAGSDAAGCSFTSPVSPRPAGAPRIWAGVDVLGAVNGLTFVQDGYAHDVASPGLPGGIAALDHEGRIRWRATGALKCVLTGSRLVGVQEAARGLAFTITDIATGRTVARVFVADKIPGVGSMVAATGYSWTQATGSAVLVSPAGKYATVRAADAANSQVTGFDASPASSHAVVTLAAFDRKLPAQSYVVGP